MIHLREASEADTDRIIAWRNQPDVMEHFFYRYPFTRQGHLAWREQKVLTGKTLQFIICLSEDHATGEEREIPIGSCTLQDIENGEAEYGYYIGDASMRGKGYGTLTTRAAIDYARDVLHLRRLRARVMADNAASLKSFEKAGFRIVKEAPETVYPDGYTVPAVFLELEL